MEPEGGAAAPQKVRKLPAWMTQPAVAPPKASPTKKSKTLAKEEKDVAGEWLGSEDSDEPARKKTPKKKKAKPAAKKQKSFETFSSSSGEDDAKLDKYGGSFIDDADDPQALVDDDLPVCRYGEKCFRKNPQHLKEFAHPWKD